MEENPKEVWILVHGANSNPWPEDPRAVEEAWGHIWGNILEITTYHVSIFCLFTLLLPFYYQVVIESVTKDCYSEPQKKQ